MDPARLLQRLREGRYRNVRFTDAAKLPLALGFTLRRIRGSHHIFGHPSMPEFLNLQKVRGQAQPYQLRQLMRLVEEYSLSVEP